MYPRLSEMKSGGDEIEEKENSLSGARILADFLLISLDDFTGNGSQLK